MKKVLAGVMILCVMAGCSKDPANNLTDDELGVYITNRDAGIDFSTYTTFGISDSVAIIRNGQLIDKVRSNFDVKFVNEFANQMTARGYTRVSNSSNPDLVVTLSRIYNDYTGVVSYPDYWGGFGGYWDPYYWGYPGYGYYFPGSIGVYTVTDGALAVDMFDLKNAASHNNQLYHAWSGLVRGSTFFDESRAEEHARALFTQSTYITRN